MITSALCLSLLAFMKCKQQKKMGGTKAYKMNEKHMPTPNKHLSYGGLWRLTYL